MLENYHIILASNSPRRRELLGGLGLTFDVRVIPGIDESYPQGLPPAEIPVFIARRKAGAYIPGMKADDLIITADTVVVLDGGILEKPSDRDDAVRMLKMLSGRTHTVVTGVAVTAAHRQTDFSVASDVVFAALDCDEINYYVDTHHPYDKAGAYGIQEWIGYVGVQAIYGSFYNVMGLPVQRLYQELKVF
ncbi:MAG: Maf-like protein [Tannerella sp.]|jgi:septum formation protein|nr:Maf-like protein [Tannerella sp.]